PPRASGKRRGASRRQAELGPLRGKRVRGKLPRETGSLVGQHEPASGRGPRVPPLASFGASVALGFVAWGVVAARYLWPALRDRPRADALRPLLLLHSFRFIGLAFVVPGVVSPDLPAAFARPAAYGDLIAALLALLALAALRSGPGIALVWVFNVWG